MTRKLTTCHDCGVSPGELHVPGCDVERCPRCGHQLISCNCIYEINGIDPARMEQDHHDVYTKGPTRKMLAKWDAEWDARRMPWSGEFPGDDDCYEFGWFAKLIPGAGWQECSKDDPEAEPDLNKLGPPHAKWNATTQRWVRTKV